MRKASWRFLIFGMFCSLILSCNESDDDNEANSSDFQFQTVFRCDGTFMTACEGGNSISEYTQVRVLWDWNENGPDSTDYPVIPPGNMGLPEAMFGAFADFYVNESEFISPVFFCTGSGGMLPRFYLRLYTGDEGRTQWTSPVVSIYPHSGSPDTVDLPASEWTCAIANEPAPRCEVGPSRLEYFRGDNAADTVCFETCAGRETFIQFSEADSALAGITPIMQISGSCDDVIDAQYHYNPAYWVRNNYGNWWTLYDFYGLSYGKLTLTWLDQVPCTGIDSITILRSDSSTLLSWQTTFELNCASFEVWQTGSRGNQIVPGLKGIVAASNASDGAYYEFVIPPLPSPHSYEFMIVAVDNEAAKYPCIRQTSAM